MHYWKMRLPFIDSDLLHRGLTIFLLMFEKSEWLLFNVNSAIFQLYHGENKLIFNEMLMRSFCSKPTRLVGCL